MKKFLSILLSAAVLCTACSCTKTADKQLPEKNNTEAVKPIVEWNIENNTLVFSGSARMADYNTYEVENESVPWFSEKDGFSSVKISGGVTRIGSFAFYKFSNIESAEIAGTVDSIGSSAFAFCENLVKVTLGEGVREIGMGAFGSCTALEEINIPSTVTKIDKGAFYGCSSLEKLEIPSTVTSFGDDLFTECSSLTIYCEEGSDAQAQAEKYGIPCVFKE